jgi:hypothetical protein
VSNPTPGLYDQAQLETVKNSESLAANAKLPAYNPALIDEGMQTGTPDSLLAGATAWRKLSQQAVDADIAEKKATGFGTAAETALRRQVEYFRGKAQLSITQHPQWADAEVQACKDRYFIGTDIFANEATAGQSAAAIFDHAEADSLPAITPAKLAAARAILDKFNGTDNTQSDPQSAAAKARALRDAKFAEIMNLRHEIQHTANGAYPWWDDTNIATRRLFMLPIGRPFTS